jgi:hypothetical protein
MGPCYVVGVESVDRSRREIVVLVIRYCQWQTLPRTFHFFAGILHDFFNDTGIGSTGTARSQYEDDGLLERPPSTRPEPMSECYYDGQVPPEIFIEHVEMIRWCGPPNDDSYEVDYDQREKDAFLLQAEYLVRVTDEKYLSCRVDPTFIGHFYIDTVSGNKGKETIALGPRHPSILRPMDTILLSAEQGLKLTEYAEQHLGTIEQCLEALPKILQQDPIHLTPDVYPRLSSDQQEIFLTILLSSTRRLSTPATAFELLDRGTIFHILSFLPLKDVVRPQELKHLYLALEHHPTEGSTFCLNTLHESSMRHFSLDLLLNKLACMAEKVDDKVDLAVHNSEDGECVRQLAASYGTQLQQIIDAVDNVLLPALTVPAQIQYFQNRYFLPWMRKRLQAFMQAATIQGFVDNISAIAPGDL